MTLKPKTIVLFILLILFGTILFYSNILQYPINCKDDNFVLNTGNSGLIQMCKLVENSSIYVNIQNDHSSNILVSFCDDPVWKLTRKMWRFSIS